MARTKQKKLASIIDNKALDDGMVVQIGEHSLTVGELRSMDAETGGESTAELQKQLKDIESRENNLVTAQGALASTLQLAADKLGVGIDDLIAGNLDSVQPKRGGKTSSGDAPDANEDPLSAIDPAVLAALEKKFGVAEVKATAAKLEKELKDTRQALGIALKVNMDDHYERTFRESSKDIPAGVKLDLQSVLKYADDNQLKDKTGRYNVQKAINDLTLEARHKADIEAAEQRGIERGRLGAAAASAARPGANRAELLKPPVDDKGRTHTIEHQLQAALADSDIQKMLAGPVAEA